jgi:hypothetical protein
MRGGCEEAARRLRGGCEEAVGVRNRREGGRLGTLRAAWREQEAAR